MLLECGRASCVQTKNLHYEYIIIIYCNIIESASHNMMMSLTKAALNHTNCALRKRRLGRFHSSKSSGQKLSPLPSSSSPAQAKSRYLKSAKVNEKYLSPEEKIMHMNREIEIVREQAAAKLENELKKSIWKKLTDPLVKHKHSLYNVLAMTLAYVLAHNLYVTSKKEKECKAELLRSQNENSELKQSINSLLDEATLRDFGSTCALEIKRRKNEVSTSWLPSFLSGQFASAQCLDENSLRDLIARVLREKLSARMGFDEGEEKRRNRPSVEEIMQQNQEMIKASNSNPEFLLQDALQNISSREENGKEPRRVFNM